MRFRHYKGGVYELLYCAEHTETGEQLAIYHKIYEPNIIWARPVAMFHEVLPDGRKRFEAMVKEVEL